MGWTRIEFGTLEKFMVWYDSHQGDDGMCLNDISRYDLGYFAVDFKYSNNN